MIVSLGFGTKLMKSSFQAKAIGCLTHAVSSSDFKMDYTGISHLSDAIFQSGLQYTDFYSTSWVIMR